MSRFHKTTIVIFILLAGIGWYLTTQKNGQILGEEELSPIKIGAILPLTGRGAVYGEQWQMGLRMAVEKINTGGAINGRRLELIFEDNQADAKLSVSAFEKLTKIDGAKIVFTGMSNITASLAPLAEENKIILFGAATTNEYADNYSFVFKDYLDIYQDCKILAETHQDKEIVLLGLNRDTTTLCKNALEQILGKVDSFLYEGGEKDFKTHLIKIKTQHPDFIMVRAFKDELINILKQAKELGIKTPLICPVIEHACNFPEVIETAPALFVNAVGTGFSTANELTSDEVYFFDDMSIVAEALRQCSGSEDVVCLKNKILQTQNYSGLAGNVSFNEKGISIRPVQLLEFKEGKWVRQ